MEKVKASEWVIFFYTLYHDFSVSALLTLMEGGGFSLMIVRCLTASLASTHQLSVAPPPIMTIKDVISYCQNVWEVGRWSCWRQNHSQLRTIALDSVNHG